MTKVYGPRDLREAYMMPREDAVWIMEHCAEVWEKERNDNAALRERLEAVRPWLCHASECATENFGLECTCGLAAAYGREPWGDLASQPEVKP